MFLDSRLPDFNVSMIKNHQLQVGENAGQEVKEEAGDDAGLDQEDAGQSGQDGTDLRGTCRKNPQGANTELGGPKGEEGAQPPGISSRGTCSRVVPAQHREGSHWPGKEGAEQTTGGAFLGANDLLCD